MKILLRFILLAATVVAITSCQTSGGDTSTKGEAQDGFTSNLRCCGNS